MVQGTLATSSPGHPDGILHTPKHTRPSLAAQSDCVLCRHLCSCGYLSARVCGLYPVHVLCFGNRLCRLGNRRQQLCLSRRAVGDRIVSEGKEYKCTATQTQHSVWFSGQSIDTSTQDEKCDTLACLPTLPDACPQLSGLIIRRIFRAAHEKPEPRKPARQQPVMRKHRRALPTFRQREAGAVPLGPQLWGGRTGQQYSTKCLDVSKKINSPKNSFSCLYEVA